MSAAVVAILACFVKRLPLRLKKDMVIGLTRKKILPGRYIAGDLYISDGTIDVGLYYPASRGARLRGETPVLPRDDNYPGVSAGAVRFFSLEELAEAFEPLS